MENICFFLLGMSSFEFKREFGLGVNFLRQLNDLEVCRVYRVRGRVQYRGIGYSNGQMALAINYNFMYRFLVKKQVGLEVGEERVRMVGLDIVFYSD